MLKRERKLCNQLINFNPLLINEDKHAGEIKYKTLRAEKMSFFLLQNTNKQAKSITTTRGLQSVGRLLVFINLKFHEYLGCTVTRNCGFFYNRIKMSGLEQSIPKMWNP